MPNDQPTSDGDVETLPSDATGSWLVTTETSSYLLDLDAQTATRYPGTGTGNDMDHLVADLRRDADAIPLLGVTCTVGKLMVLALDLRGDGVLTARLTTAVTRIEPVPLP